MRRRIDPGNCTLVEYAYARTGSVLKAGRVVGFMTKYAAAREALGTDPSTERYADWWGESYPTAYRHAAEFRAVIGQDVAAALAGIEAQRAGVQDRIDVAALVAA